MNTQLHCRDDVIDEGLLLLGEFLLLLRSELTLVLVFFDSDKLVVANFDLLFKQVLNLNLC